MLALLVVTGAVASLLVPLLAPVWSGVANLIAWLIPIAIAWPSGRRDER
jgi:hypothetical protein